MKYIDADSIKDEIKHLKIDVYDESHQFDLGARCSLTFLESFIDSLQQEQPEIFDTAAFQKGVQEGRRLEREDAGRLADASKTISEDLEEAAENPYVLNDVSHAAFEYERTRNDLDARSDNEVVRRAFIAGFKAGAEMMKAKMMDDAYEEEVQEVYRDEDGIHCSVSVGTDYKPGTIVYVITIPKEDEQ